MHYNYKKMILPFFVAVTLFTGYNPAQNKEDNFLSKIKFNALLSGGYEYNFNTPSDMKSSYRIFDYDHNSFKVDMLEFCIRQDANDEMPFGFKADIVTGTSVPKIIRSSGLNAGDIDVMQMYLTYILPIGNGIRIDFGKFATHLGYEVIENYENFNDNHSRSFSFGYSIPFTHTGIKAGYSFNENISLAVLLVNGWDNAVDNNSSKSIGAQLALAPADGLNIYANYMTGPEQNNNNSDYRSIADFDAVYSLNNFTIGLNTNFAQECFSLPTDISAKWSSYVGYLKYNFSDTFSLSLRGELFKDSDGLRTGTAQELTEITLTPSYAINSHILIRGDLRFDSSDKETFTKNNSFSKNQVTIGFNFIYHF